MEALDGLLDANVSNNLSNEPRQTGPDNVGREPVDMAADLHQRGRRRTRPDRRNPGSTLITRRSRVQIPPPPPSEGPGQWTWAFVAHWGASPASSTGSVEWMAADLADRRR
jgi:hypothetical protein